MDGRSRSRSQFGSRCNESIVDSLERPKEEEEMEENPPNFENEKIDLRNFHFKNPRIEKKNRRKEMDSYRKKRNLSRSARQSSKDLSKRLLVGRPPNPFPRKKSSNHVRHHSQRVLRPNQ